MPRFSMVLSVVALVMVGSIALGAQPRVIAQEATPAAEEGQAFEPVAFAMGVELPSPADLFVARISLEPGTGFPIEDTDPSSGMLIVESGAFTVRVEAPITVTRGGTLGEAMAAAAATGDISGLSEAIPAGEEVVLATGDAAYIPGSVSGEIRNDGEVPAVGLAFLAAPAEGMMAEATPAP